MTHRKTLTFTTIVLGALLALAVCAMLAQRAAASQTQISIFEDDGQLAANPAGTLQTLRQLGASTIRLSATWMKIAPSPNSFTRPSGFNATDPAAYPARNWTALDTEIRDASADGIAVDLNVTGGVPLWAAGPGFPFGRTSPFYHGWEPSASQFGQFVHAVAVRYGGSFDPLTRKIAPHNKADLPRVSFWSIWNEPNEGAELAPQAVPGYSDLELAPELDRALIDSGWSALQGTGHGSDTILFGDIAPRGAVTFGDITYAVALDFVRTLYCVGSNYRPLSGFVASLEGCPSTAAGTARFAAQNPALFKASGFADHAHMSFYPPNHEENLPFNPLFGQEEPNFTSLGLIGQLENALNRVFTAYGSRRQIPIYDTEFGYMSSPPKHATASDPYLSQTTAAYYDNWAEYISWKDPRIVSFDQYLLEDLGPATAKNGYGSYASGLLNYGGKPKPGFAAWRLPIFMPQTTGTAGRALEVWGAVRPVHFTRLDIVYDRETVNIMFAPLGSHVFKAIDTVAISSPEGYFDTHVVFPSTGTVELSWTYPTDALLGDAGQRVTSRQVRVTINHSGSRKSKR